MKIVIIYHSGYGHTKIVAGHIQKRTSKVLEEVALLSTLEAQDNFELLHKVDTLAFGCPGNRISRLQKNYGSHRKILARTKLERQIWSRFYKLINFECRQAKHTATAFTFCSTTQYVLDFNRHSAKV